MAEVVDPFARNSKWAKYTNDLDPNTTAEFHLESVEFLDRMKMLNVSPQAILLDPPYSPRQISECYKSVGKAVGMEETQNARLYKGVKQAANRLAVKGTVIICCGWNSAGMGGSEYEFEEILLVPHGGAHNDTIVTVETKISAPMF